MPDLSSRTVVWYPVHKLVAPALACVGSWPTVGTLAWLELDDHNPVKWAAVLDGGRQWALHLDTRQEALAEASHAIAGAADWSTLARNLHRHSDVYIPRRSA